VGMGAGSGDGGDRLNPGGGGKMGRREKREW
jgi:hypothetical protein